MPQGQIPNLKEIGKNLNELSVMLVKEQGLQFATFKEAKNHVKDTATKLREPLRKNSVMFIEGLQLLAEKRQFPAAEITARLPQNQHNPQVMATILETDIINDSQSQEKSSEVTNSFTAAAISTSKNA